MDTGGSTFGVSELCAALSTLAHSALLCLAASPIHSPLNLVQSYQSLAVALGRFSHIACGRAGELLPAFLIGEQFDGQICSKSFVCISDHLL